jgi:SAM-dependent methyltransferase
VTTENPWNSEANAEEYDHFVRDGGIYRHLARDLATRLEVDRANRVLDIACGTGAATEACLSELSSEGEVVGLDASAEMVAVAEAQIPDPRAHFRVAAAADLAQVCDGPVDRAVCSAALWHFPSHRAVFRALAQVLDPVDGVFAFNLSAAMVRSAPTTVHPFQVTLTRAIEEAGGGPPQEPMSQIDLSRLDQTLVEEGFEPTERSAVRYRCAQRELMNLVEIPALMEPLAPELGEWQRAAVVQEARRRSDPEERVEILWFSLRTRLA